MKWLAASTGLVVAMFAAYLRRLRHRGDPGAARQRPGDGARARGLHDPGLDRDRDLEVPALRHRRRDQEGVDRLVLAVCSVRSRSWSSPRWGRSRSGAGPRRASRSWSGSCSAWRSCRSCGCPGPSRTGSYTDDAPRRTRSCRPSPARVADTYSIDDVLPRLAQILAGGDRRHVGARPGADSARTCSEVAAYGTPGRRRGLDAGPCIRASELGALVMAFPANDPIDPAENKR